MGGSDSPQCWSVLDHVCRVCLGRILTTTGADGQRHYRCADCGSVAVNRVENLCACGATLRTGGSAGLRCVPNPERGTPEAPPEVVVRYVGVTTGKGRGPPRLPRPRDAGSLFLRFDDDGEDDGQGS